MIMRRMLTATLATGILLCAASAARADSLDDSIAQVRASEKKGDDAKTVEAMKEVAKSDDPRATTLLVGLTENASDAVACAAYQLAAPKKDSGFLGILKSRAENKKLAESTPKRVVAVLDALAVYADKSALPVLADVFTRAHANNADISVAAARAYASVRSKPVVDQLIKWLLDCESVAPISHGSHSWPAPSKETQAVYAKCHEQIVKDLQGMTGQQFADYNAWKAWWKDAEQSFKFPDPPPKK